MKHLFLALASVVTAAVFSPSAAYGATINVFAGGNINQAIENASPGDLILLAPGTYTPQATTYINGAAAQFFWLTKAVTVKSTGGAAVTILNASPPGGGLFYALWVRPIFTVEGGSLRASIPSGAVLDGVTINSTRGGIVVSDPESSTVGGIRNVQIRNTIINADSNGAFNEDGIVFQAITDSVLDGVTINKSANNGINLANSSGNIIMNSTVNNSRIQQAIVVFGGSNNQVLNNVVTKAARNAIAFKNSNYARIEGNTLSGYFDEGITLTDSSSFAAVVHNTTEADAYRYSASVPSNKFRQDGVGLWLNCGANANYVAGNYTRGAPEVGLAVYASSNNYIVGNTLTENLQGGVLTRHLRFFCDNSVASASSATTFNTIHRNNANYQEEGGGILSKENASNNDIAFNHISSFNAAGQRLVAPGGTAGFTLNNTAANKIFANTVYATTYSMNADNNFANTRFFRNRLVQTSQFVIQNTGSMKIDDEFAVGGNFWDVPGISGNPGPNITPFSGVVVQAAPGVVVPPTPTIDRYPYALQSFGRAFDATIKFPVAGAVVANGRRTRIEWHSDACGAVNVVYSQNGSGAALVAPSAAKIPNTGYYMWTPALPAGGGYIVGIECLTTAGVSTGIFRYSAPFTIANNSLALLAPHSAHRADAGSTLRVVWRKTDPNALVNVFLSVNGGAESLMASNVAAPFADITLPNVTSDTARIRIASATGQDGTDGYFSIRRTGATGVVTSIAANQNIQIGYVHDLRWASVAGSTTVDLAFWDGAAYRDIILNLADRGNYSWFVQEVGTNDSKVRVTFKGPTGAVLSTAESTNMNIVYRTDVGVLQTRYRLFNLNTREHLYTTDLNEYTVLGGFADWKAEGPSMRIYNSLNTFGSTKLRPYYRLFNTTTRLHYWTIDRTDYFTKRALPATWNQEGVDGYIWPIQVGSTVPLYRLYFAPLDKFLWTVDFNEYNFLTTSAGWTVAGTPGLPPGVEGYVER